MPFKLACCIVQYDFAGYPLDKALRSMKSIGFEGVETNIPSAVLSDGRTALSKMLRSLSLEPVKLVLGGYGMKIGIGDLAEKNERKVRTTMKNYRKQILLANDNGFPGVCAFTGPVPGGMTRRQALRAAAPRLAEAADFAEANSVQFLIETHDGALANDSKTLLELRKLSGSKNVYANVDPSNYFVVKDDVVKAVRRLGPLVRGVHVKDVILSRGKAYWAPAGDGRVDWLAFLKALASIGYDKDPGWVPIEYEAGITGKFYSDPERGSREGFEYINSLLAKMRPATKN